MKNIVVFASGTGTNFQAIIDSIDAGDITDAQICGLVASKPGIEAIERARRHSIPVHVVQKSNFKTEQQFSDKLEEVLSHLNPDLIVLAGYLHKIPSEIISKFPQKIINIHPALLPKYGGKGYYGHHVHEAVLEHGDKVSGCTVHYVNEKYDQGPIIEQREVTVEKNDTPETLAKRVSREEHQLLPSVIEKIIHNKS